MFCLREMMCVVSVFMRMCVCRSMPLCIVCVRLCMLVWCGCSTLYLHSYMSVYVSVVSGGVWVCVHIRM